MSRVAVGISGGVDSAVAALLLRDAGHEIVGVHLYCYPAKSEVEKDGLTREDWIKKNGCRADEDKKFALKTALELDIPFVTLDFSEEYNSRVVDYFYREYEAGRTPNPDVLCNSEIKFGLFLDWALENGFDFIVTGHYARIGQTQGSAPTGLFIPQDKHKDQTYFLWKLTQKELKHVLFPLGDLLKSEVRKIAKGAALPAGRQGLSVANRKDSQGICFVGNVAVRKFLARRLKMEKGEVINISGETIGTHDGIWFYTIGQRGGWDIFPDSQRKMAVTQRHSDTPALYVISKDARKNELVVAMGGEEKRQKFGVGEVNWISSPPRVLVPPSPLIQRGGNGIQLLVRIRHGGKLIKSKVERLKDKVVVEMDEPQRGVAPGQSAVFYAEDGQVLGGGVIE